MTFVPGGDTVLVAIQGANKVLMLSQASTNLTSVQLASSGDGGVSTTRDCKLGGRA